MGRLKKNRRSDNPDIHCKVKVILSREESFYGAGVARLLEEIEKLHSISCAARQMNMAYSKALHIIKEAEEALGILLVERQIGGERGGGSKLTEQAKELNQRYLEYEKECVQFAEDLFMQYFSDLKYIKE